MKLATVVVLGALVASAFAFPSFLTRLRRDAEPDFFDNVAEIINMLRDEEKLNMAQTGLILMRTLSKPEEYLDEDEKAMLASPGFKEMEFTPEEKKFIGLYNAGVLYTEFVKDILIKGRTMDEDALMEYAIPMAASATIYKSRSRDIFEPEEVFFNNETIATLQGVMVSHELKKTGTNIVEALKGKHEKMYKLAKFLKDVENEEFFQKLFNDEAEYKKAEAIVFGELTQFGLQGIYDWWIETMQSLEGAKRHLENLYVLISVLKKAESFENLKTLHTALSESKTFEAINLIIRDYFVCYSTHYSEEVRSTIQVMLDAFVTKVLRAMFIPTEGNKVDASEMRNAHSAWQLLYLPSLTKIVVDLEETDGTEIFQKLEECLLTEKDKEAFKLVVDMDVDTMMVSDEKLQEMRGKSEKAYGAIYLLNNLVKDEVTCSPNLGLGSEALTFYLKYTSVPHTVLSLADGISSESTQKKFEEVQKQMISEFNALPEAAKKELVSALPYTALMTAAEFD